MSETDRDRNKRQRNGLAPLGLGATAKVILTCIYITKHVLLYILTRRSTNVSPLYVNASMLIATAATLSPTLASTSNFSV